MGDPSDSNDPKVAAIPAWQREESSSSSSTASPMPDGRINHSNNQPQRTELQSSSTSLIKQASKFLQADQIQNAPVRRKISFLESKGLSKEKIKDLLGSSQKEDISTNPMERPPVEELESVESKTPYEKGAVKVSEDQSPMPTPSPSHDMPPIITYPEFLLHAQKPPPLVTMNRLLTGLYVFSGAAATVYGAGKYVFSPMTESLTAARHSFFENVGSNLEALTKKLEQVISVIPDSAGSGTSHMQDLDDSSAGSDPSDLLHRSAATQTSPGLIRSLSSTSSQISSPVSPLTDQHLRLQSLHTQLLDLLLSNETQSGASNRVKLHVNEFQSYLDGLAYSDLVIQSGLPGDHSKVDEISKVKAEIRSVKGALLSARNFPSGVGIRGRS